MLNGRESDIFKDHEKEMKERKQWRPKNREAIELYFSMYEMYSLGHMTITELSRQFGVSANTASKAIKWAARETNIQDHTANYQALDDKLSQKLKRMEIWINETNDLREKLAIEAEQRRTLKFQAQLRKVLQAEQNIINAIQVNPPAKEQPDFRDGAVEIPAKSEEK